MAEASPQLSLSMFVSTVAAVAAASAIAAVPTTCIAVRRHILSVSGWQGGYQTSSHSSSSSSGSISTTAACSNDKEWWRAQHQREPVYNKYSWASPGSDHRFFHCLPCEVAIRGFFSLLAMWYVIVALP